jgi:YbbR domain-containing protein
MIDRWLANDWVLRILSLLLAIGIWWQVTQSQKQVTVSQSPTVVRKVSGVSVSVTNTAKLAVKVSPEKVSVQIRGPAQIVDALRPGAIRVTTSVPYAQAGRYRATLHASSQVGGTQVVSVTPDQVRVTLSTPDSH